MTSRLVSRLLTVSVVGWGCAYYNGLYNANRLADDAARARREGRTGEARAIWRETAVKAESVATHYRRSRYRDDALLLQGRALLEAEQCDRAVLPLTVVVDSSPDPGHRHHAALLLGECRVVLGDPERARQSLGPLVDDPDASLARSARVWRARAALAQADYAGALGDLTGIADTSAVFDRASALVGLGNVPGAVATLAARAPGAYDERRWPGALDALGAVMPEEASALVDSLVRRGNLSPGQRGRLLLADATRWEHVGNPDRARSRLLEAAQAAPDSTEGRVATVRGTLAEIRELRDVSRLPGLVSRLREIAHEGGEAAVLAAPALAVLAPVVGSPQDPTPAFRQFLLIEVVRDSLGAAPLAGALFRKLQRDFPESPVAPKALLAAAMVEPDSAAVLGALVDSLYPTSPYRLAPGGGDAAAFAVIEDSLRSLAAPPSGGETGGARKPPASADPATPRPSPGRRLPEP